MFFSLPYDDFMIYSTIRGAKVGKISELCKFFAANRPKIITEKVDSNACGAFEKFCPLLTYIIHSGFISGYQNRYGDNLKPPTNVYHRMTA